MESVFQPIPLDGSPTKAQTPATETAKKPAPRAVADVLPTEYKHAAWRRRVLRNTRKIAIVISILLVSLYINGYVGRWTAENNQSSAQGEVDAITSQINQFRPILDLNTQIEDRRTLIQTITDTSPNIGAVTSEFGLVAESLPYVQQLTSVTATLTEDPANASCGKASPFAEVLIIGCLDASLQVDATRSSNAIISDIQQAIPQLTGGAIASVTQSTERSTSGIRVTFGIQNLNTPTGTDGTAP